MQPFLADSCNTTALLSSGEIPKYLELLADNVDVPDIRDTPAGGYEVPRPVQILDKNDHLNKEQRKSSEVSDPQSELPQDNEQLIEEAAVNRVKRESAISLHSQEHKRSSLISVGEKFDVPKLAAHHIHKIPTLAHRNSQSSVDDSRPKCDKSSIEIRGSLTSLSGRSSSSQGSSASLTPSTRPSSSLINSQNTLPLKNSNAGGGGGGGNKRNSFASDPNAGRNTIAGKLHRTHSVLQGGKANIPLAINSALLNSLRQTPSANDDSNDVATYSNINSEAVKVNG